MLCKFGDKGPIVQAMQMLLLKIDPNCLPRFGADGDYGQETADAMSRLVSGGPGQNYGPAEYAQLFVVLDQHVGGGAATLVPHDHPVSVSVSITGSGSGSGRTGAANPT